MPDQPDASEQDRVPAGVLPGNRTVEIISNARAVPEEIGGSKL